MIRRSLPVWMSLLLVSATGCTAIQDSCIEAETSMRNHVLASKAWAHWSWCYDDLDYPAHFAKGFKAGYEDVLAGGKGCQPTLPPRWYWKPCYQSPEGRCKIAAWFDGFSHGAVAAQQDGYGNLGELPLSPTARANMMTRNAPVNPACFDGMYHGEVPVAEPEAEPLMEAPMEDGMGDVLMDVNDPLQAAPNAAGDTVVPRPYDE